MTISGYRRAFLIAVALLVLGASEAHARTTIDCEGCSAPYQRWVNRAHVPTPPTTLTVHVGMAGNPCGSTAQGCTDLTGIWVPRDPDEARFILLHELGHNVDANFLSEADRGRLAPVLREPDWFPGGSELFANSYGICALHAHITAWWIWGVSRSRQRHICGIIRRLILEFQPREKTPEVTAPQPVTYLPAAPNPGSGHHQH